MWGLIGEGYYSCRSAHPSVVSLPSSSCGIIIIIITFDPSGDKRTTIRHKTMVYSLQISTYTISCFRTVPRTTVRNGPSLARTVCDYGAKPREGSDTREQRRCGGVAAIVRMLSYRMRNPQQLHPIGGDRNSPNNEKSCRALERASYHNANENHVVPTIRSKLLWREIF